MFGRFDRDWPRFWIHLVIGVLLGAVMGFHNTLLLKLVEIEIWTCVILHAALFGILGGLFGDTFWHWLKDKLHWFN